MSRLSVVMASYGHADVIEGALLAMLNQSRPPDEVIVVDDASVDGSLGIVARLAAEHPNLTLIRNESNVGAIASAERGVRASTGDLLYQAGADDRALPYFFEVSCESLAMAPEAALCCSVPLTFVGGPPEAWPLTFPVERQIFAPRKAGPLTLWIAGHTTIMRRSAYDLAGGLIPALRWHSDWFALLVMAYRHGFVHVAAPLAALRVQDGSYSHSHTRKAQLGILAAMERLLESPAYVDVAEGIRSELGHVRGLVPAS